MPLRGEFFENAAAFLEEARVTGQPVALLVIDVDHFKLVNDTYGHLQGDDVLRVVADIIRRTLRGEDLAARYAGDEFVALLPTAPLEAAREVAGRICASVRNHAFTPRDRTGSLSVTLSIGVASFPEHGEDIESVFAAADRALYRVKREGRDGAATASSDGSEFSHLPLGIERFVGRGNELRTLIRLLDHAVDGKPQLIAINGEAGVGKTTLIRQLEPEIRLRAGSLVMGRCHEADVQPPYGPWAEVITALRRLDTAPPRDWRELPNLVPALGTDATLTADPRGGSKYLLLAEIAEYIQHAAAQRPIVIVLDDMQWADSASWDALEHLLPQLVDERVLVCLTTRSEEARGEVVDRRRRLSRDERFHEIALDRLSHDEIKVWIEAAFHKQNVGRELLAYLYRQTEGNALFVVQVLRTLIDEGAIWHNGNEWEWRPVAELRLPAAITDLISRRLSRLSPKSHDILTTAAVIGREFDLDLAIDAGAASEDDLLDALDEGVAAAVLQPVAIRGGDCYAFAHDKLAEVLRGSVNARRLRRIHQRVAQAMERRSPDAVEEIAAHFDRADDRPNAFRYALLAARRAKEVYAHAEGTEFLHIAERTAASPAELADVRVRLAEIAEAVGRYEEAEELCELAIQWFTSQNDGPNALTLRRSRERIRGLLGQPAAKTLHTCAALDTEARALGMRGDSISLLAMISQAHGRLGDQAAAARVAREAVKLAEEEANPTLLADSLNRLAITLLQSESTDAAAVCHTALEIYQSIGECKGQASCHNNLSVIHMLRGEWRAAERELTAAIPLGRKAGAPDLSGLFSLNLGVIYHKCGDYDHARQLCGEALAMFAAVKNSERELYALYNLAHIDRESGRSYSAAELYEVARSRAEHIGQADVELGSVAGAGLALLALGDTNGARESYVTVGEDVRSRREWFQGRELVEALQVRFVTLDGNPDEAFEHFDRACELAESSDLYSAIWLAANSAEVLLVHDAFRMSAALTRYEPRVSALGYKAMSARYRALLDGAQITG